jgi:uncharacterized protein (DUF2249 family)
VSATQASFRVSAPEKPKVRTVDVRKLIAQGKAPFAPIMRAVGALAPGEAVLLVTPFLPSPLIEKLPSEGFSARPERRGDGAWQTRITRAPK